MKIFKSIKRILLIMLVIVSLIAGLVIYSGYDMYAKAISDISIEDRVNAIREEEDFVTIDKLPKEYIDAVVAVEDHRFFTHNGIDPISLIRAIYTNISTLSLREGGSTITQQLAKNLCFTQEKKLTRKIAEIFATFDLEKKYEKDEIFELYVNISYFGDGYYGIGEAARGYLNKEPKDMTLEECTLLAGLPNAPSVYELSNNSILTIQRQVQVIDAMVKYDKLDVKEAEKLKENIEKSK